MTYKSKSVTAGVCLLTATLALGTTKQAASQSTTQTVAYVYVSHSPTSSYNDVQAYSAASNGRLTPVEGSPFNANVTNLATNGKYLYGSTTNGIYIDAYAVESDGALHFSNSINAIKQNPSDCGNSGPLVLDRTGSTLYDLEVQGDCSNNLEISFATGQTNSAIKEIGSANGGAWLTNSAAFASNNVYAYSASCLDNMYWEIFGFKRTSDGLLKSMNFNYTVPTPKSGDLYCPSLSATDNANHVVFTMQPTDNQTFNADGNPQLATYTVEASGNLSTTSTRENMPATSVVNVTDIAISPSAKLLAVGGTGGLQIFHFNGANPATTYTGLLTKDEIDQFYWDNNNHLYAISIPSNKLFVYTITPSGYEEAPGSPYYVTAPVALAVRSK